MVTATAISPMFRASLADAVGWFRGALRVRDRGNVPQGRSGDGGAVPLGDWYLLSKRRSRWPGRSAGCRPVPSNRARQKARQPASPRPRTRSSNPIPSSRESFSFWISPWFLEKPGFSASVGRMPDGAVGRDAQVQQHRAEEPVVSLSGDISVPQCRRCGSRRWSAAAKRGCAVEIQRYR